MITIDKYLQTRLNIDEEYIFFVYYTSVNHNRVNIHPVSKDVVLKIDLIGVIHDNLLLKNYQVSIVNDGDALVIHTPITLEQYNILRDILNGYYIAENTRTGNRYMVGNNVIEVNDLLNSHFYTLTDNTAELTISDNVVSYYPLIKYKFIGDVDYRYYTYRNVCLDNLSYICECLNELGVSSEFNNDILTILTPIEHVSFTGIKQGEVTSYFNELYLSDYMKDKIKKMLECFFIHMLKPL